MSRVVRVWRGPVARDRAQEYQQLMRNVAVPDYRSGPATNRCTHFGPGERDNARAPAQLMGKSSRGEVCPSRRPGNSS